MINRRANYSTFALSDIADNFIKPNTDVAFRTSQDGGVGVIAASNSLVVDGFISANSASNGISGALDISADKVAIVAEGYSGSDFSDALVLVDSQLNNLNVGSLLVGGQRQENLSATNLSVSASEVIFNNDINLNLDEIIAVASDAVDVNAGASITSVGLGDY